MKKSTIDRDRAAEYLLKLFNQKVRSASFRELGAGVLSGAYFVELGVSREEKQSIPKRALNQLFYKFPL